MNTGVGREELERDYDRILFCTPTRRLADKTQVFPMEENTSIRKSGKKRNAYERYAYGKLSENYRRVHESSNKTDYDSKHLLCDAVSGMTEPYLIKTYHELRDLHDGPT